MNTVNATNHWLDLLAEHEREAGRRGSDYALSQLFDCTPGVLTRYRKGARHLSDGHCLTVAHRLGLDPLQVFASVNAERAEKEPALREFWTATAKKAARAAAVALAVMVSGVPAPRAEAHSPVSAGVNARGDGLYNAHRSRRKRPGRGLH